MAASVPNRGPQLLGVDIALLAAAVIAYGLRCYVRIRMVKAFGFDDWLMGIATLFFVAYSASSITGVTYGTGRHHKDLPIENVHKAMNCWWFCYLFYCISMISSKMSIGFFLLRIAFKKLHSWIIYGAMFISCVAGVVFFFVTLFQCHPISRFWNKQQGGTCINSQVIVGLAYLYSVFSIISDFTFAILPVFLVWNLQLNRRTKIALVPLLTMGCIASSAVAARLPYLPGINSPDFLWATLDVAIWSTVEQGLAITAGSLATLRPLFQVVMHKFGFTTITSRARPSNYGMKSPSSSQMLGSRSKISHNDKTAEDLYKLSAVVEEQPSLELKHMTGSNRNSTTWFQGRALSTKKKEPKKEQSESVRSLQSKSSTESVTQDGMQIMVSKSFFVTDEKRPTNF